jgi:thymidylate synthase
MRFFTTFGQAINEITRDLAEMGLEVHPQTMQDKYVGDDPNYATKELQNYMYTVFNPLNSLGDLNVSQPWADLEFGERIAPVVVNPGEAYKTRIEVWNEFLHDGKFAYTYNERLRNQLWKFIHEIQGHPDSRQLYVSIWDPNTDPDKLGGGSRVPCSLGYLFQLRNGKLNMTYMMRSCDFITHLHNDAYLATRLMDYVAYHAGVEPGDFTHFIGSLHVYKKDVKGVF